MTVKFSPEYKQWLPTMKHGRTDKLKKTSQCEPGGLTYRRFQEVRVLLQPFRKVDGWRDRHFAVCVRIE